MLLSYNSADYIVPCVRSVVSSDYDPLELTIVDNASSDNSVQVARTAFVDSQLPGQVLVLEKNLGCAGGNNAGWRAATGRFVIFLNPDTEVLPNFISELVAPLHDSSIGATGAKIYYPGSRKLQHAGAYLLPNGLTNHYGAGEEDRGQHDAPRDVDYVTGAGFAIRRDVLEKVRGFDEDFFPAYFEEVDLCTRVRRMGLRIRYVPTAVMYHHESVSLLANSPRFRRLYQRMRIRYCIKNLNRRQWLRDFIPFEARWMVKERAARYQIHEQLRAYMENVAWLISRLGKRK